MDLARRAGQMIREVLMNARLAKRVQAFWWDTVGIASDEEGRARREPVKTGQHRQRPTDTLGTAGRPTSHCHGVAKIPHA